MHQLLAEPLPQRLEEATPVVGHEQDQLGEHKAAALQIDEQCDTDLVILRGALPKSQGHLQAAHVHAHEGRIATPVDRV
jgi:hypothetical protein